MGKNKRVFNWQLYLGFILLASGGLFLADQMLDELHLMRTFWPLLVVLLGITFFIGMLVSGKRGAGLAIPGAVFSALGILLFIQNIFSMWITWSYAWALLIAAVGVGMLIMNLYLRKLNLRRVAGLIIGIGLTLFVVFGILFEVVFFRPQDRGSTAYFLGGGLVLLGLFILFSRPLFAERRKKAEVVPEVPEEPVDVTYQPVEEETEGEVVAGEIVPAAVEEEGVSAGDVAAPLPEETSFTGLHFESVGKVFLAQGDHCEFHIEGDPELKKDVRAEVAEGFLTIIYEPEGALWDGLKKLHGEADLQYYITMKDVEQIALAGAGDMAVEELQGTDLAISHDGLGKMSIKELSYQTLDVDLSGLGLLSIKGEVQSQNVDLDGAGSYEAQDLKSQQANVSLSGAGTAKIWVEGELNATLSGAGSIKYKGDPQIEQSVTGLGSIKPL